MKLSKKTHEKQEVKEIYLNPEKKQINAVYIPTDTLRLWVSSYLRLLRKEKNYSYTDISKMLDIINYDRSRICCLEKKHWFPKDPKKVQELVEKILKLN